MSEINKLRQRLTNIGKNVTEYRMSVTEAKDLVKEFAVLEQKVTDLELALHTEKESKVADTPFMYNLDGGTF